MTYFYDYFAKEYREGRKGRLFPDPAAMFRNIDPDSVQSCRRVLKNAYAGYREGRNAEALKRLLGEYREYVSRCHDGQAVDRHNAFVYRYMLEIPVGSRAAAAKLGVAKETVLNYIDRCINEMLVLCMGVPAVVNPPEDGGPAVRMLIEGSRLFGSMAGDYVLDLFPGRKERDTVGHGRQLTAVVMGQLAEAAGAYSSYCNDSSTRIDTDIRKAEVLEKCLAGVPCCQLAAEYGCHEGTIYSDMRDNEKRLAAMLFNPEDGRQL